MVRRVPVSLGAVLLIGCGALAGCGSDDPPAKAAPSATHTTTSPSPQAEQTQTPKVKVPRPKDPLAPNRIKRVVRDGKIPHPTVSAPPASIKGVVSYDDGVELDITGIHQGRVTGQGPGVVEGPTTTFSLSLTNGGKRKLDLSSVVVTLVYGKPGRIADPIYGPKSRDFAGIVKPAKTSDAVYTFMIPVTRRSQVTIHVDFDAVHTAAVFSGSAR